MSDQDSESKEEQQVNVAELDDTEFSNYILYILDGDENSGKAVKAATGLNYVPQEVGKITKPYPDWLRGVPTLVDKSDDGRVYKGTECLDKLQELRSNTVNAVFDITTRGASNGVVRIDG
jgi:hypothetical protein